MTHNKLCTTDEVWRWICRVWVYVMWIARGCPMCVKMLIRAGDMFRCQISIFMSDRAGNGRRVATDRTVLEVWRGVHRWWMNCT